MSPTTIVVRPRRARVTAVPGAAVLAALTLAACGPPATPAADGSPVGTSLTSTASVVADGPTAADTTSTGTGGDHGTKSAGHGSAHWGYAGVTGPEHWADLDPAYGTCRSGRRQSPVDLRATTDAALPDLTFDYRSGPATVLNPGHTVQVAPAAGNVLGDGARRYGLLQFHVHTPSEHTVNGAAFPAEVHFVHRADDGALSVVGVLVQEGAASPTLDAILAATPAAGSATPAAALSPADLLPAARQYVGYSGSLTTPPCSEDVDWHVLATPITASAAQLDRLRAAMGANARPVQQLNGRELRRDTTTGS